MHIASYFTKMSGLSAANPTAKLTIFSQCLAILPLKSLETQRKRIALNITNAP
jgi:hypothetical protein